MKVRPAKLAEAHVPWELEALDLNYRTEADLSPRGASEQALSDPEDPAGLVLLTVSVHTLESDLSKKECYIVCKSVELTK